jgi:hypothetical protein
MEHEVVDKRGHVRQDAAAHDDDNGGGGGDDDDDDDDDGDGGDDGDDGAHAQISVSPWTGIRTTGFFCQSMDEDQNNNFYHFPSKPTLKNVWSVYCTDSLKIEHCDGPPLMS